MVSKKRKREAPDRTEVDPEVLASLKVMFPNTSTKLLTDKLARGDCFDEIVESLQNNHRHTDDSVIQLSEEEDSDSNEEGNNGFIHTISINGDSETFEERCLKELKEVVALSSKENAGSSTARTISVHVLRQVARRLPTSLEELEEIPGLSKSQAKQFKCVILAVTRDYSNRGQLDVSHNGDHDDDMADISITEIPDPKSEPSSPKGQTGKNFASLSNILPFVDPKFLLKKAREIGDDEEMLQNFIVSSLESRSRLPTKKEFDKAEAHQKEELAIKKLNPKEFLAQYDDPHQYFMQTSSKVSEQYKKHALYYITKHFPTHPRSQIEEILDKNKGHFVPTIKQLEKTAPPKKGKSVVRASDKIPKPDSWDLTFLKEYVYFKLEPKIRKYEEKLKEKKRKDIEAAKKTGALFECQCCFDSECLLKEVCMCDGGCMFCKDCLRRGAGVAIGDSKTVIECLAGCGQRMGDDVVKSALSARMFERLLQRRQMEEIEAAGLEDLEKCPACSFATIMPNPEDKLLVCGNPECGKETCRLCKEDNHVPLSCEEVEKDHEVSARTKLENAATEAMIRQCSKCKKRFFKEEGCNKMQCECGQSMCYLCRKPVEDSYTHFYGQGGDPIPGKCPLWSDNKNLHKDEVIKAVEAAKKKIDVKNLKNDPTKHMERPPEGFDRNVMNEDMVVESEDEDEYEEDVDDFLDDSSDDEDGYRFFDYDDDFGYGAEFF